MRHAIRKLVTIVGLGTLASVSSAAFANSILYDCSLVANDTTSTLTNLKLNATAPLTLTDRQSAMTDLKAYCCQQGIITGNECESAKQSTSNPESPYIFDQLVSRGFFKLDNKTEGSRDTKATEWAEKVKEWVESGKGKAPVGIQNTFEQIWQPAKWDQARVNGSCEITNYDSLDLAARYGAVCKQAACMAEKFVIVVSDLTPTYDLQACRDMATKRINDELTYVQTLMVRKSNTLMKDVWQTYTQSYLLENRWGTLIDKISRMNESFSAVNGKVQEGTKMCSKG